MTWCASDPGKTAKPRRCRFLHKWEDIGLVPLVTMLSECQKCGWQKTWDGFTDTTTYYPPGSWKSQPSHGLNPRHEHDWKPIHTVASGWTIYRCTTCRAEEIG